MSDVSKVMFHFIVAAALTATVTASDQLAVVEAFRALACLQQRL
jgi:hypothetical protein